MDGSGCDPQLNADAQGSGPYDLIDDQCGDCGVRDGGHHHESCLDATCRVCGGRWAMCEGIDHFGDTEDLIPADFGRN